MSNGDFEVMPIGTMEEVREMRRLSNELIELEREYGIDTPQPLRIKILEIARFYRYHSEKFPVTV
jgi:hypothetical protein